MKTARIIIFLVIASLVLSAWTPATAKAKAGDDQAILVTSLNGSFEGAKVAYVTIDNRTGGTIFLSLNPQPYQRKKQNPIPRKSYSFLVTAQGKTKFPILAGIYVYTIRSSNCGGKRINTKIFTGETILGPYYCQK
jgi:hypothetical protein